LFYISMLFSFLSFVFFFQEIAIVLNFDFLIFKYIYIIIFTACCSLDLFDY